MAFLYKSRSAFGRPARRRRGGYRSMRGGKTRMRKRSNYGGKSRYKKRGNYKSTNKNFTTSAASKELAVYKNPYSTKTQQPRIPDGSRNYSLGVSYRSTLAFGITTATPNTEFLIILNPTAKTFGAVFNRRGAPTAKTWSLTNIANVVGRGYSNTATVLTQTLPTQQEAWRVVSIGCKIKSVADAMSHDGWWSAIRWRGKCERQVMCGEAMLADNFKIDPAQWPNDPSYSSGRIADLHKKDFMLAVEDDEHQWTKDFKDAERTVKDASSFFPDTVATTTASNSFELKDESIVDNNYDSILIYIAGSEKTQLLADFYGNYEITAQETSDLNKYQTLANQVKPATITKIQREKRMKTVKAAS